MTSLKVVIGSPYQHPMMVELTNLNQDKTWFLPMLTTEEIENLFPEGASSTDDGHIQVTAQWLHEFAFKVYEQISNSVLEPKIKASVANRTMSYSDTTKVLTCYAPVGEEVLTLVEPDFNRAYIISNAIQKAYIKGFRIGRLELQRDLEQHLDQLNHF